MIYRILGEIHIHILAGQLRRHLRLDDATGVCSYGVVRIGIVSWQGSSEGISNYMMQPGFASMALLDPLLPDSDIPLQTNTTCGTVSAPLKMRRICATFRGCDEILLLRGVFNMIYRILGEIHIRILAGQLGRHLRLDDATGVCSYGVVRSPFTVLSWQKVVSISMISTLQHDFYCVQRPSTGVFFLI
ncbi:hypothetical protein LXL04_017796 [Taraxacum kok-saghyz]